MDHHEITSDKCSDSHLLRFRQPLAEVQTATCWGIENMLMFWTWCHNKGNFPCKHSHFDQWINWGIFTADSRLQNSTFSFHQIEKNKVSGIICVNFYQNIFQYRGKKSIKIHTNYWGNLIFLFWWNENNTMEIPDGWVQSGIRCIQKSEENPSWVIIQDVRYSTCVLIQCWD